MIAMLGEQTQFLGEISPSANAMMNRLRNKSIGFIDQFLLRPEPLTVPGCPEAKRFAMDVASWYIRS